MGTRPKPEEGGGDGPDRPDLTIAEWKAILRCPPHELAPSEIERLTFRDLREWILVERDEDGQPKRQGEGSDPYTAFAAIWTKRCEALGIEIDEDRLRNLFVWHLKNEEENGGPERWRKIVNWLIPGFEEAARAKG